MICPKFISTLIHRKSFRIAIKRKSKNATYLKRGDIVQVEAVHLLNGSIKFWNEHTQRWDFLYTEEIKLTIKSVFGEISELKVEPVFGESSKLTVEPVIEEVEVKQEVKPIVKAVIEEVEVKPEVEPIVEPVVGEIRNPKNYWNCDEGYSDNGWLESHYKIRVNGRQRSINYPEIGCTGPYYSYDG